MNVAPILSGDNTIPGEQIPDDVKKRMPEIFQTCSDFGLDYPPTVVEFLDWDTMAEICSYGGFPSRYPHWSFGMEWEEFRKGYLAGRHRVYEIVINSVPVYLYCLNSNTYTDNVTVIAHALGHADFFKTNIFFKSTNQHVINEAEDQYGTSAVNEMACHGTRIRKYFTRRGKDQVGRFIDKVLMIRTLIDPSAAWERRKCKEVIVSDNREYKFPKKVKVDDGHDYMDEWLNTPEYMRQEEQRIKEDEIKEELNIFSEPTRDIFGFLKNNAPLNPWQQDVMSMLYNEELYFSPQRPTKILNEGWASYVDFNIMARMGLALSSGIFSYAHHKAGVLGGKYSMNPYKLGFNLLLDIEERWNKGRFGSEYEKCDDITLKHKWDKKLGLGREKVFEVRKYYNDMTLMHEFLTPEFIAKYKMFEWRLMANGEYQIVSRDPKAIKKKLMQRFMNGGLPDIKLEDPNYKGKGYFLMQHNHIGLSLLDRWVKEVLPSIFFFWKNKVLLATKAKDGQEMVYVCGGETAKDVKLVSRNDLDAHL